MDFEQNDNAQQHPVNQPQEPHVQPPQPETPMYVPRPIMPPRQKKRSGWRIFLNIILALSVFTNVILFVMLIGLAAFFAVGKHDVFVEEVIQKGPASTKIAIVKLEGVIDTKMSRDVCKQFKTAREDDTIKGIILRINSPGGMITPSDEIYNEIRNKTKKPVLAFMEAVAASGGYYAAAGCDTIMAEKTTITGSIGVIAGWFVVKDLLEEKLGVQPVFVKSGPKKDWPSSFKESSPEIELYLYNKLIAPAYRRFLDVVAEGRSKVLEPDQIKELADGSIYYADEALQVKLIDSIGYLEDAIEQVKILANVDQAQVIEYHKPFSLAEVFASKGENSLKLDRSTLLDYTAPRAMYFWAGQ
jgi:protease-4